MILKTVPLSFCCILLAMCMAAPMSLAADIPPPPGIPAAPTTDDIGVDPVKNPNRPAAWDKAMDEANKPHLDDVLSPRPLAMIVGAAWFLLAFRLRRKRKRQRVA